MEGPGLFPAPHFHAAVPEDLQEGRGLEGAAQLHDVPGRGGFQGLLHLLEGVDAAGQHRAHVHGEDDPRGVEPEGWGRRHGASWT